MPRSGGLQTPGQAPPAAPKPPGPRGSLHPEPPRQGGDGGGGLGGVIWKFVSLGWGGWDLVIWGRVLASGGCSGYVGVLLNLSLQFLNLGGGLFVWGDCDGLFLVWGTEQERFVLILLFFGFF